MKNNKNKYNSILKNWKNDFFEKMLLSIVVMILFPFILALFIMLWKIMILVVIFGVIFFVIINYLWENDYF